MAKRLLVIQEHNAKRAGLHWDVRFEDGGDITSYLSKRSPDSGEPMNDSEDGKVLRSFVIPKHDFPTKGIVRMAILVEDHPWSYRNFEGTIEAGYGAGDVKLIFCDYVEVSEYTDKKIRFDFGDHNYTIFKAKSDDMNDNKFLVRMNS
jgi:hypothetical protein